MWLQALFGLEFEKFGSFHVFFSVHIRNLLLSRDLKVFFSQNCFLLLEYELLNENPAKKQISHLNWEKDIFKFEIPESGSKQMNTSFTAIFWLSSNTHPRISIVMWISQSSNFRLSIYCSGLAILTSVIAVIENTNLQIFNQIVFILYRGSVFGWYLTTLTATFPMKYFGRLYGLGVVRFSMNFALKF